MYMYMRIRNLINNINLNVLKLDDVNEHLIDAIIIFNVITIIILYMLYI